MSHPTKFRVIRDPLWNTIRLDPTAVRIMDTAGIPEAPLHPAARAGPPRVPGGHPHPIRPRSGGLPPHRDGAAAPAGAGGRCRPKSGRVRSWCPTPPSSTTSVTSPSATPWRSWRPEQIPADHEAVAAASSRPRASGGPGAPGAGGVGPHLQVIRGEGPIPLRGLVSGSLDLDKMEYLRRDARFCGVPYGEVDVDRLLQGLALLPDPEAGRYEVGVHEKAVAGPGVAALRQVPDVPERVLAPRRARGHGALQAHRRGGGEGGVVDPVLSGGTHGRGAPFRDRAKGW